MTIQHEIAGGAFLEYGRAVTEYDQAGQAQVDAWHAEQVASSEFQAYLNRVAPLGGRAIQG